MSRKDFYNSTLWRKTSKMFVLSKSCICEKCGKPIYCRGINDYLPKEKRRRYIVHHKIALDEVNYKDENISLNWDNLQLLCIDCHNSLNADAVLRDDVMFDENGNLIKRVVIKRKA